MQNNQPSGMASQARRASRSGLGKRLRGPSLKTVVARLAVS
jgi:hypothetical protein